MNKSLETTFGLLKETNKRLKGKFVSAFIGAIAYALPLILIALIPYVGWVLSVLLFGHLTTGYINYVSKLLKGEDVKLYHIFEMNKHFGTSTFLGAILVLLILVGFVVLIVPGILAIAYFSFSLHVLESERSPSVLEVFRKSAQVVKGKKVDILSYKILYYLLLALGVLAFTLLTLLIVKLYATLPVLAVALIILLAVVAFILVALFLTYYTATNEIYYREVLVNGVSIVESAPEIVEETQVIEVVEEALVVEEANEKVAKPAAKKPAAKKPTPKKPAAKKTTVKKDVE